MDLSEFIIKQEEDIGCTNRVKRRYAINFFSNLAEDTRISSECRKDLIKIGENIYFTTFTDDSGYIPGAMDFSFLDKYLVDLRTELLNYIQTKGNWVVKAHIQDYLKQKDLSKG